MIPIYIGYDRRETVAYHVLAHTLLQRSSLPLAITPVGNGVLPPAEWSRPRGEHDSTDFSNARFVVPSLQRHRGWAIFMDCDMVCLGDIADLWAQRDERYAVQVVKHRHTPRETTKFLGAEQAPYPRKNWSSLMLLNCAHPSMLDRRTAETLPGLDLHGFHWCRQAEVGEISGLWNVLATDRFEHPEPSDGYAEHVQLLHYTLGGPWHGYRPPGDEYWWDALIAMLGGDNPCAQPYIDMRTKYPYLSMEYERATP